MTDPKSFPKALFDRIDDLVRLRDSDVFTVPLRSFLGGDAEASHPYEVSHAVHRHLDVAFDHLLAIRLLAVDANVLPTYAAFTLIRAAVENLASAMWRLAGPDRRNRVLRELQFQWADAKAAAYAQSLIGEPGTRGEERMDKIREVAGRNGLRMEDIKKRSAWKQVVRSLGLTEKDADAAELIWASCSAFAHGDQWPSMSFLDREELDTSDEVTVHLRVTASFAHVQGMLELALTMAYVVLRTLEAMRLPDLSVKTSDAAAG